MLVSKASEMGVAPRAQQPSDAHTAALRAVAVAMIVVDLEGGTETRADGAPVALGGSQGIPFGRCQAVRPAADRGATIGRAEDPLPRP